MRYAICGNYGVGNLGDEIILENLKRFLRENDPGAEFVILGKGMHMPFFSIGSFLKSIVFPQRFTRPLRAILWCDRFILGGGGLFDDTEKRHLSAFWAAQGLIAGLLGRPVFVIGVSAGDMSSWSRFMLRQLLRRASFILTRDEHTQKMFASLGAVSKLGSDLAVLYSGAAYGFPARPGHRSSNEKYILICLREFKNFNEKLYKKIAQANDEIIQNYGLKVILFPFQGASSNDRHLLNKIFDLLEHKSKVEVEELTDDVPAIYRLINNAEFVVTMRLHPGIVAGSLGIPVIPISYMGKVDNFWKAFNIKPVALDDKVGISILEKVSSLFNNERSQRSLTQNIKKEFDKNAFLTQEILRNNLINTRK